jgi:hypothetical protein
VLLVAATACERVVSVQVGDVPAKLVVEARLERVRGAVTGTQQIRLTTTAPYFSAAAPPAARGAIVRVVDDSGRTTPFAESASEPGTYATSALTIGLGRRYSLRITYKANEYQADEVAVAGVAIDSLYFRTRVDNVGPAEGLRATLALTDPVGTKNWYLWDQYIDDRRLVTPDTSGYSRVVGSDDLLDGASLRRFQPYGGIVVKSGQRIRVRQVAISEQAFRFYQALSEQTLNDGSPFGVPPSSLRGNIANVTSPATLGLGYFIVGEVVELERVVP